MKKLAVIASIILVIGIAFFLSSGEDSATPETPTPTVDASTKRTTDSGEVIGFRGRQDSLTWLGIPFAKPPTGDLRWRAPLPADAWQDELEATRIGEVCAQFGGTLSGAKAEDFGKVDGSEDCLFLNIWAPATAEPGSLPVMFWIHGGGNSIGHGGSANYDGANLATGHGVIFVSINYRLGPFGWFTHPALRTETQSPEDNSGNYGTFFGLTGPDVVLYLNSAFSSSFFRKFQEFLSAFQHFVITGRSFRDISVHMRGRIFLSKWIFQAVLCHKAIAEEYGKKMGKNKKTLIQSFLSHFVEGFIKCSRFQLLPCPN